MADSEERHAPLGSLPTLPDVSLPFEVMAPFDDEAPPQEFDEYRLIRLLGEGAMGRVYLALDTSLHREVAIKLINQPSDSRRERFLVEARAAARLQHPNIVSIYRIGELEGQPYLVEEYVRGQILAHIGKPMPWQDVLDVGIALARGLAAAHRRGVLHRDIKPENVILSESGDPKLVDFGLAKLIDEIEGEAEISATGSQDGHLVSTGDDVGDSLATNNLASSLKSSNTSLTQDGAILGTPYYMAPEIWQGATATQSSDVYSFGVVLFELCAGRVPFYDVRARELQFVVDKRSPPGLATRVGDVDSRFAAIVERCIARLPQERYPSGESVLDALAALHGALQTAPLPSGSPYRGLQPFEAEHRAIFFGREFDIREVIDRLRGQSLTLIAGESGVGKSSLARAGVLPALGDTGLGGGRTWKTCAFMPGTHPLSVLAAELARATSVDEEAVADELANDFIAACQRLRRAQGSESGLILFADQLEELVTLSETEEAAATSEALAGLAQRVPGIRLLATVRGDKLTEVASLPGLGNLIEHSLYILRPLGLDEIREAVVGPARVKGVRFESDSVVATLVESAMQAKGGLPLLQFALTQLWDARDHDQGIIPDRALDELGGVEGALSRHADRVFRALLPETRAAARKILLQLVTLHGTRSRHTEDALIRGDRLRRAALRALVEGRLVVVREVDGSAVCEIAHEALLTGWRTLRQWLDEEGGARAIKERLAVAAQEWDQLERPRYALWRGLRLREAAELDSDDLPQVEVDFIKAGVRDQTRGRRVRNTSVIAAFVALVVVLIVVLQLNRRANEARESAQASAVDAQEHAEEAQRRVVELYQGQGRQALLDGSPMQAFAYLLEAMNAGADNVANRFMVARATQGLRGQELVLPGHEGPLYWAAVSPDGTRIATAGMDGAVKLWDAQDGELLHDLPRFKRAVWMVAFSPDGRHLAAASFDGSVKTWTVATGEPLWFQQHGGQVFWVGYAPDGTRLATTSSDETAKVWDAITGENLVTLGEHSGGVKVAAFDAEGRYLVTGSQDRRARIWSVATGELLSSIDSHEGGVEDIRISRDGRVATASKGGTARVFDLSRPSVNTLRGHTKRLYRVAFNSDGSQVVTASEDGLGKIWQADTGRFLFDLEGHDGGMTFAAYSPDDEYLLTASRDGTLRTWEPTRGSLRWTHVGHLDGIWMADFDARGDRVVTAGFDGTARVWDARQTWYERLIGEPGEPVEAASFSPDGTRLALARRSGMVEVWSVYGRQYISFSTDSHPNYVGWSPDGTRLITSVRILPPGKAVSVVIERGNEPAVWDALTGERLQTFVGHQGRIASASYSDDGARIVTAGGDGTAKIWSSSSDEPLQTLVGHQNLVRFASFNPQGTLVVTASDDHTARVWNVERGTQVAMLEGHNQTVNRARFSPDGLSIVTASEDKTCRIWSLTGKLITTLEGHSNSIPDARFSLDGQLVATASEDGTVKLWDVASGSLLWSIDLHQNPAWSVDFSPDGQRLLIASGNAATLWDVSYDQRDLEQLEAFAACRVSYQLSQGRLQRRPIDHDACRD